MNIRLDLIKPSPRPVRTSWDEDKMNELAQSIKEQGVIVPIKVRPLYPCTEQEAIDCGMESYLGAGAGNLPIVCSPRSPYHRGYGQDIAWMCYNEEKTKVWEDGHWCSGDAVPIPFEIVYGHRRVEAARRAGLDEIPAIVEGIDDTDALVQALIENIQRENLDPLDEARSYRLIADECDSSMSEVAQIVGKPERVVYNIVALLDESPTVQQRLK